MLANPLLVLLDLKDPLQFTPEQVAGIQGASTSLQEKLSERRASLGGRFDGVPSAQQAQLFQQIQPEIEVGREDIRAALRTVEGLLTPAQWAQVPAAVKDPFAQPQGRQGGGAQGGGGGQQGGGRSGGGGGGRGGGGGAGAGPGSGQQPPPVGARPPDL
jgi:hypothetical protein